MSNEMIVSPYNLPLSNDIFTFSDDRISVDDGKIVVDGVDGGFEDEFNTLDTSTWTLNDSATVSGGKLSFSFGGGTGDAHRFIGLDKTSVNNFKKFTIEINDIEYDAVQAFYIGFSTTSNFSFSSSVSIYNSPIDTLMLFNASAYTKLRTIDSTKKLSIKLEVDNELFLTVYTKQEDEDVYSVIARQSKLQEFNFRYFFIKQYFDNKNLAIDSVNFYGYPTTATATLNTAEALKADPSTKLKNITSFTIGTTGSNTNPIILSTQKKDSRLEEWSNFDDEIGESDTISSDVSSGGVITFPTEQNPAPDREILPTITFSGDGVTGFNSIDSIVVNWESDVEAPTAPTATEISQDGEGGVILAIDGLMPADAYGAEIEVNLNGAGYLPISKRGQLETGQGYLIFRGNTGEEQRADEVNSMYWPIVGLSIGDTVQIRSRYVDAVGNKSAFTESGATVITEEAAPPINIPGVTTQSYEEEFEQLATLFDESWKTSTSPVIYETPIIYPNVAYTGDEDDTPRDSNGDRVDYVRFFVTNGDAEQISMGGKNTNIYRHTGMVTVKIFTLKEKGVLPARILADKVCTIFRSRNDAGICFKTPKMVELGVTDDGYYQVNCMCVFDRDSFFSAA